MSLNECHNAKVISPNTDIFFFLFFVVKYDQALMWLLLSWLFSVFLEVESCVNCGTLLQSTERNQPENPIYTVHTYLTVQSRLTCGEQSEISTGSSSVIIHITCVLTAAAAHQYLHSWFLRHVCTGNLFYFWYLFTNSCLDLPENLCSSDPFKGKDVKTIHTRTRI